ncbi:MAG: SDR family oxidoreductase [Desulfobacteraceae bacterium]|nr:SDR family oxidoreductase [Desulfobacteraceae bacterium]
MTIQEPAIDRKDILVLDDSAFNPTNVCIVTGAGTGIGRATAVVAAVNGLTVVGLDINVAEGKKTVALARELGGAMIFEPVDLADDQAVAEAVQRAEAAGKIRYLANIAGIQHIDAIPYFPMEMYDAMQNLMLRAPFLLSKLVMPRMRQNADGGGVIGHMASIHAHICTLNKPVYNITKFGLRALAQSISAEGQGKIRSFTVSTGFVQTPLALKQIPAQAAQRGISEENVVRDVMMGKSRVKEMMTPVEVANLFVFGFSRFSRYLVGGDLLFDGGVVLTY